MHRQVVVTNEARRELNQLPTPARLAQRLGLEFHIDVTPTTLRISA